MDVFEGCIAWFKSYLSERIILQGYNEGLFLLSSNVVTDCDFEQVLLSILKLHLRPFNGCSLIQLKI